MWFTRPLKSREKKTSTFRILQVHSQNLIFGVTQVLNKQTQKKKENQ